MKIWSDNPTIGIRFNQDGYSSPTIFPTASKYRDLSLFLEDIHLAVERELTRRDWCTEQHTKGYFDYIESSLEQEEKTLPLSNTLTSL